MAVEDQRAQRLLALPMRRWHMLHDRFQQGRDVGPLLGRDAQHILSGRTHHLFDLLRHRVGLGGNEVDLVHDRDDLQVVFHGQVQVSQRLRLDPLRGVHHQDRALARLQRPADLVRKVHVAGCIDQVQLILVPVRCGVTHAHRRRLDRHAFLALEIHGVQHLRHHIPLGDRAGCLQQAIRQGRFAVVNMGDNTEVADELLIHRKVLAPWRPCG